MIGRAFFLAILMGLVSISVAYLKPAPTAIAAAPDLEALLPERFAGWVRMDQASAVLPPEATLGPGEAVAYRAYRDPAGRVVTLVAAYGPPLGDSVRLHRPESCYVAQGFSIRDRDVRLVAFGAVTAPTIRLVAQRDRRTETVSYVMRDGDAFVSNVAGHGLLSMKRVFDGASDGILIRISTSGAGAGVSSVHDEFLKVFGDALSPEARHLVLAATL